MNNKLTLIATTTFGLEAVVKREILDLGFANVIVSDGRLEFDAAIQDIPHANLWLRSADRVLLKLAEFNAADFDQLFDQTKALPWEHWITKDGKITVTGKSVRSKLVSVRACQSIVKKAIVERLKQKYHAQWFKETGPEFTIQVAILKDVALLTLDTSGMGLHKRGYRDERGEVPIRETLAAALVQLSSWKQDILLMDPMCGAGTILIEAAMLARNIAPGLKRKFAAEQWPVIDKKYWDHSRRAAKEAIKPNSDLRICGYDIDKNRIRNCQTNAKNAGVEGDIVFAQKDIKNLRVDVPYGMVISNPPYGIKLSNLPELTPIYYALNTTFYDQQGWSLYILTADKKFPDFFKRSRPDKVRKLYNGTIEVHYYQYYGKKANGSERRSDRLTQRRPI
jgi:putative N6-adenine-specific DNA methylase